MAFCKILKILIICFYIYGSNLLLKFNYIDVTGVINSLRAVSSLYNEFNPIIKDKDSNCLKIGAETNEGFGGFITSRRIVINY